MPASVRAAREGRKPEWGADRLTIPVTPVGLRGSSRVWAPDASLEPDRGGGSSSDSAFRPCGLGHVDVRSAGAVGVGHDPGNVPPDDERVQFPDTPVVLRKATDPPKQKGVLQRAEGEALMEHAFHFHGCRLRVRPALGMVEAFHKQDRSLLVNNTRLGIEIGNPQDQQSSSRQSPEGILKRRWRIRAAGRSPRSELALANATDAEPCGWGGRSTPPRS